MEDRPMIAHTPVSGVWSSADGRISLELRLDGAFTETHAALSEAFTGVYVLVGEKLKLFEDSGAVATGRLAHGRLSISEDEPSLSATKPLYCSCPVSAGLWG
jgi:hypothetical protein